jgi:hypothetical protein
MKQIEKAWISIVEKRRLIITKSVTADCIKKGNQ